MAQSGTAAASDRPASAWFWTGLRWVYAGLFLYTAGLLASGYLPGAAPPPPEPTAEAEAFLAALRASGFVIPMLIVTYVAAGLALLRDRTAPLGVALLGPPIVVIFLFHIMLSGRYAWGGAWAAAWLLLAWRYRAIFAYLWSPPPARH